MKLEVNIKDLLGAVDVPAQWVGLREVYEAHTPRMIRDGAPLSNGREYTHGIMVEVLANGQFGYYGTPDMTPKGISEAAKKAYKQAEIASHHSIHSFDEKARPSHQGSYSSPFTKERDAVSPGALNELLLDAYKHLKVSDKIVSASSLCQVIDTSFRFVSSNGSDIDQEFLMLEFDLSATAADGTNQQTRTFGGMRGTCRQMGMEYFDKYEIFANADRIGAQAVELLDADDCPTGDMDAVIAPDQMMLQIHESIGHALEVDRILGDERNYAGWSFVKLEDFGSLQYGSKVMNITFDPTLESEFASYAYDDGGLKATKEYLIKDGLLVRGLGGQESQIRSGLDGVANFRASSWNRAPIDRMANINLEPGDSSFEDLISQVEYGVYMESNKSWSIDDYRNKFQFGCEYGKLIENGKLTKTVKNPNYRGISTPFWNSLKGVGNIDTFGIYGTPNCGKGEPNQVIRVGHASPTCLFENIQVFGGV
jgi:predicted Zn-dependent protease|tara:strand:+ start:2785 stop:4227 length:1443 start_codon:yes stop_codon:yes gene_type:complete